MLVMVARHLADPQSHSRALPSLDTAGGGGGGGGGGEGGGGGGGGGGSICDLDQNF